MNEVKQNLKSPYVLGITKQSLYVNKLQISPTLLNIKELWTEGMLNINAIN